MTFERRSRTFSDMSIAESCIDKYDTHTTLLRKRPGIGYISDNDLNNIKEVVKMTHYKVTTVNILTVSELVYIRLKQMKMSESIIKTVIIEIVSFLVDESYVCTIDDYTPIYIPIMKDILPVFIDYLICNNNKTKKKKFRLFNMK